MAQTGLQRLQGQRGHAEKGRGFSRSSDALTPSRVCSTEGALTGTQSCRNIRPRAVMLLEGSVQIASDQVHGSVPLTPGMQASFQQGDATPHVQSIRPGDTALAWRQGKLILDNLALADALPLINRYLSKPVMLADANTGAIRIGGIYNISEVNNLIPSLPKVLPVYLTQNQDGNPYSSSVKAPKGCAALPHRLVAPEFVRFFYSHGLIAVQRSSCVIGAVTALYNG